MEEKKEINETEPESKTADGKTANALRKKEYKVLNEETRSKSLTKKSSKTVKYIDMIVGKKGIFALLKYELLTSCFASWPGALGIALRSIFFKMLFKKVGRGVTFGKNLTIRHPHKISIGDYSIIDENCLLDAKGFSNNGIEIGKGCFLGRNSILSCKDGDIILEENVNIGFNCEIFSGSTVKVGRNTLIAAYTYLISGDHAYDFIDKPITEQEGKSIGVEVGANCWLGAKSMVLDGVKIGNDCVIGAAAVVNNDISPFSIAVGIPARVIKSRK